MSETKWGQCDLKGTLNSAPKMWTWYCFKSHTFTWALNSYFINAVEFSHNFVIIVRKCEKQTTHKMRCSITFKFVHSLNANFDVRTAIDVYGILKHGNECGKHYFTGTPPFKYGDSVYWYRPAYTKFYLKEYIPCERRINGYVNYKCLSWIRANELCKRGDGHLLVINTRSEFLIFHQYLPSSQGRCFNYGAIVHSNVVFIGLTVNSILSTLPS